MFSQSKNHPVCEALELELVNGIRTTQAAQVKLQQDIVAAGGEVAAGANASSPRDGDGDGEDGDGCPTGDTMVVGEFSGLKKIRGEKKSVKIGGQEV